jgi:pimeloyl-ACP methyl ester carboxylesterase
MGRFKVRDRAARNGLESMGPLPDLIRSTSSGDGDMTSLLLVHGAWHGGWCYRRVENLLRANGHTVFTPTLTGLGDRSHLFRGDLDLDDHVADVLQLIYYEDLDDIVLVGHSYGGMVVSVVADRAPEKIRTLVYLDAFVPEEGKCQTYYIPEELNDMCRASAATNNGGVSPIPAEAFQVNDADVDWVNRLCVNHPIATFQQSVRFNGGIDTLAGHRVFISASNFDGGPFGAFYAKFSDEPSWTRYSVASGHDVMVDAPQGLTEILEEVAG